MKHSAVSSILVAAVLLGLAGCSTSGLKQWTERLASSPRMYPQDQEVTLVKPFSMKIEKAYWCSELPKPGYEAVPPGMRDQFTAKPSGRFLVIEMAIINLDDKPTSWGSDQPPVFTVKNKIGTEYASVGQDINMQDLTATIILGETSTINPGMVLRGKKVFDLPVDEYVMDVSLGRHAGGWSYNKGQRLFTWGLAPSEK